MVQFSTAEPLWSERCFAMRTVLNQGVMPVLPRPSWATALAAFIAVTLPAAARAQEPVKESAVDVPAVGEPVVEDADGAPLWPPQEPQPLPNAGYDKGFFVQSDDGAYKLILGGRVTARLSLLGQEVDGIAGTAAEDRIRFSIPRAWIKLNGHLFTPDLKYRVYVDFGRGGVPELFDAFVDYRFTDGLQVRAGQWRMPWTRQFINNIPWMSFQERSILMGPFDAGRDIGVVFHDDYDGTPPPFEYAVGIINGTGITATYDTSGDILTTADATNTPDRFDPVVLVRAAYNHNGGTRYREIDLLGGDLRLSVGAGSRLRFEVAEDDGGYAAFGVDGALQAYGFSAVAEVLVRLEQAHGRWREMGYQRLGVTAQAGYTIDRKVQPSLRYSYLDEDGSGDRQAFFGGMTVMPFESPLFRVMVEGGAVFTEVDEGSRTDWTLRQQAIIDF